MDKSRFTRGSAVALAMTALLSAAPASAALSDAGVDCRDAISKNLGKLLKTAHKTIGGCHKSRDKDPSLSGTDCNDMTAADAAKGKFASSRSKFVDTITGACGAAAVDELTAANNDGGDKEWYVTCPVTPCSGVSDNVINTGAELANCLACVASNAAEVAGTDTLGLPDPNNLNSDEQKCHGAIAKGFAKYFNTAYKTGTRCQSDADSNDVNDPASCTFDDPKGKVAGSMTKAKEGLDKSCAGAVTFSDLDSCGADLASIKTCSDAAWSGAYQDAYDHTYEMESNACPSTVRTTILGGCSTVGSSSGICSSGFQTGTVLNVGWKGLAHNVDVTDNYTLAVDVLCPGTVKGSCGTCTSQGISYDNPQYTDFARCIDDPWTKCTNVFGSDPACNNNSGGQCKYFLGPPLAVSAGGTPTCTLNVVNSDIVGGTGDPDLGTANFSLDLRAVVHLGIGQERPCPYCRNDPTPQDGNVSGGVCTGGSFNGNPCVDDSDCPSGNCTGSFGECFGGPRDGQPCDVQGFDLSFANPTQLDAPHSGNSLDCPPPGGANISGNGLAISLPLTTGASVKDAVDPCDALPAEDCFCGVCSNAPTVSCDQDTDCPGGNCTANSGMAGGVDRYPNLCTDLICNPVTSDRGVCSNTPDIDQYCSGLLFANGKGVISCGTDADCDTYVSGSSDPDDWVCPGNVCGTCSVAEFRSCFNDPITITGTPDPASPILAGAFCLPPSSNGSVNAATGSPGPGTVQTDSIVQLRY